MAEALAIGGYLEMACEPTLLLLRKDAVVVAVVKMLPGDDAVSVKCTVCMSDVLAVVSGTVVMTGGTTGLVDEA